MVPLSALLLPIVLSAVAVFIVSSIVHMVLKYHQTDLAGLPNEDEVVNAIRRGNPKPGEYMFPHSDAGMAAMKDPEFVAKLERGPIGTMILSAGRKPTMGKELALWFVFNLVVSWLTAYVACRALAPGADSVNVVRFTFTVSFIAYVMAAWPSSIWYRRPVSNNLKNTLDGVLYAAATAAVFCFMWPA